MAQLLYDRDSSKTHLNIVRRHMRLCRHVQGTGVLITSIEPFYKQLMEKRKGTAQAAEERETAYDDVLYNDNVLDDRVRTGFEQCKQFDRENPGRPVLKLIFTDGKYSDIVNAPLTIEPDKVAQLVKRVEALGADHKLNSLVAYLQEGIDNCRTALAAYHRAIKDQKDAEAFEEIAKSNLGKQYEFNYYDSVKLFGKSFANRLFPVIHSSTRNGTDLDSDENTQTDEDSSIENEKVDK